LAALLSDGEHG